MALHVDFRRSGGLAGIPMTARVAAHELPPEQAKLVAALLSEDSAPTAAERPAPGADRFSYELTLDDGDRTRTFHWPETEVPDHVQPLLASLTSRARATTPH